MLAPEQEKWIAHLSNEKKIEIIPYDPATNQRFEALRQRIHSALGNGVEVVHRGATSLGISGQGELDVYLPVLPENFDAMVSPCSVRRIWPFTVPCGCARMAS